MSTVRPGSYEYYPPDPPASEEDIQSLEMRLKVNLPEDYKDLLRVCNGWGGFIYGDVDLFGVEDHFDEDYKEAIEELLEYRLDWPKEDWEFNYTEAIPIGYGGHDHILFLVPIPEGYEYVWLEVEDIYLREKDIVDFLKGIYESHKKLLQLELESPD